MHRLLLLTLIWLLLSAPSLATVGTDAKQTASAESSTDVVRPLIGKPTSQSCAAAETDATNGPPWAALSSLASAISAMIALAALSVSHATFVKSRHFNAQSLRAQAKSASVAATVGLMKEWRQFHERGLIHRAKAILERAGPQNLRLQGLKAISDASLDANDPLRDAKSERDIVRIVSHLCDEIALRVMSGEADEASVLSFIGSRINALYALYKPMIERERELGSDVLYQAGFEALAERAEFPTPLVTEAERINAYLRPHRRSEKYDVKKLVEDASRKKSSGA